MTLKPKTLFLFLLLSAPHLYGFTNPLFERSLVNQISVDRFSLFSSWDYATIAPYFLKQKKDMIAAEIIPSDLKSLTLVGKNSTFYPIYYALSFKHDIERRDFEPDYKKSNYEYKASLGVALGDFAVGAFARIKDDVFEREDNEIIFVTHSRTNVPSSDIGLQVGSLQPNKYTFGLAFLFSKLGAQDTEVSTLGTEDTSDDVSGDSDSLNSQTKISFPNFFLYHLNSKNRFGYYMNFNIISGDGVKIENEQETEKRNDSSINLEELFIYYSFDYFIKDVSQLSISPEFLINGSTQTVEDSLNAGERKSFFRYSLGFALPLALHFYVSKNKNLSFIVGWRPTMIVIRSTSTKGVVGPAIVQTTIGAQITTIYRLGFRYIASKSITIDLLLNSGNDTDISDLSNLRLSLEYTF